MFKQRKAVMELPFNNFVHLNFVYLIVLNHISADQKVSETFIVVYPRES